MHDSRETEWNGTISTRRQIVHIYHHVLLFLIVGILVGSFTNLIRCTGSRIVLGASLIVALTVTGILKRTVQLGAQDRTIRAEENLRHYVLGGRLLDP